MVVVEVVYTVKPLKNRHIGSKELVPCWEVVRISEVAIGDHAFQWRALGRWPTVNCTWKLRAKMPSELYGEKSKSERQNSGQCHALRKLLGAAVRSRRWFCIASSCFGANGLSVVQRSEVGGCKYTTHIEIIMVLATVCVRCTEVVHILECPLIEVLL